MRFIEITASSRTISSWMCRKELFKNRTQVNYIFLDGTLMTMCHAISYEKSFTCVSMLENY